jgi:regulator of sigma D
MEIDQIKQSIQSLQAEILEWRDRRDEDDVDSDEYYELQLTINDLEHSLVSYRKKLKEIENK